MWRMTMAIAVMSIAGCTHERAVTQHDAAADNGRAASVPSQPPPPADAATKGGADDAAKSAVNKDLVKQGYRTTMRNGQLLYCRTQTNTGTRFTSQVCLSEFQIRDQERRAKEALSLTPQGTR